MTTLLVSHPSFLEHDTGPYHPERPDRLRAVLAALDDPAFAELARVPAPTASIEELTRVHPQDYVEAILGVRPGPGEHVHIDGDTVMSQGSAEAVQRAAGAAVTCVDAVMQGQARTAFAAVRPPGHHASPAIPGGFCLFNNVAVAARHAQARYGIERVAILDFDVHHGQGTQAVVEPDRTLFYASTHQYPLYPGTGSPREHGVANNVINVPLPAGAGDQGVPRRLGRAHPARAQPLRAGAGHHLGGLRRPRRRSAGPARGRDRGLHLADRGIPGDRRPPRQGPRRLGPRRRLRPRCAGRVGLHACADADAGIAVLCWERATRCASCRFRGLPAADHCHPRFLSVRTIAPTGRASGNG